MRYDLIDKLTGYVYYKDLTMKECEQHAKEMVYINGLTGSWKNHFKAEKLLTKGTKSMI